MKKITDEDIAKMLEEIKDEMEAEEFDVAVKELPEDNGDNGQNNLELKKLSNIDLEL